MRLDRIVRARAAGLLAAAVLLAGCSVSVGTGGAPAAPQAPQAAGFQPISSAGQFQDRVVGRPITFENGGVLVAQPGGGFTGDFQGETPQGSWTFEGGQLCRRITIGATEYPRVCNILEVAEDRIRFLNPDGTLSAEASLG